MNKVYRGIPVLLVLLLLAVFLPRSSTTAAPVYQEFNGQVFVTPGLEEMVRLNGSAKVIVSFRTVTNALNLNAMQSEIATNGNSILSALPAGSFAVTAQFSHIAALSGTVNAAGLAALMQNPLVTHINIDDELYMHDAGSDALTNSDDVRTLGYTGDGVRVAVIDSGIDTDHPALVDDLFFQRCFRTENDCPGGVNSAEDQGGHGTHVSGSITGATGVAPDAQIAALKVFTTGSTSFTNVLNALNHVTANQGTLDIDIINMSLGGGLFANEATCNSNNASFVTAFSNLNALGIAIFVSTGNGASTAGVGAPGCVTGAIGVGSVGDATFTIVFSACTDNAQPDKVSCYSNATATQGTGELVDILAPGCEITAEWLAAGTNTICGTSMASPTAAGIAAQLLEFKPDLTPAQLEELIEATGDPVVDYRNGVTYPRIDAQSAYDALNVEGTATPTDAPPTATATDVPSTATATDVPPTETPTDDPGSTATATDDPGSTATATATDDPGSTATPTETVGTELLVNGSFEDDTDTNKIPDGWTGANLFGDKQKCNKPEKIIAFDGECVFHFKGSIGENSKISQSPAAIGVLEGDTLALSGYVNAGGAPNAKIKVRVGYVDTSLPKGKITVKVNAATSDWTALAGTLSVVMADDAASIKVIVQNKSLSGKVRFDALSLLQTITEASSLLPLP